MSCEDYCPEIDNHELNENPDEDYEPSDNSSSASEAEEDKFDKDLKLGDKINEMIKKEINEKFSVPDRMKDPAFLALNTLDFKNLSEQEKINKVAVAFWKTGGIDMENILELKMLMVLIGTTEQMEGFKNFPREPVYKLLEMIIYHANCHMKSLDV